LTASHRLPEALIVVRPHSNRKPLSKQGASFKNIRITEKAMPVSSWPSPMYDGLRFDLRRVDHDMFDALPSPGIGDVNLLIPGLDNCRIGVLSRVVLQNQSGPPILPVCGYRSIEGAPGSIRVVVDQQASSVL